MRRPVGWTVILSIFKRPWFLIWSTRRPSPAPEFGEQIGQRGYQSRDGSNNGGKGGGVHVGSFSSTIEGEAKIS